MAISNSQELRKGNTMHHDTIALLQECSSGCKMAIESMERIKTQVTDKQMIELINKYYEPHIKLESECREAGQGTEPYGASILHDAVCN